MSNGSVVNQLSKYLGDNTEVGAYFDPNDSTPILSTEIGDYRTGKSVGEYIEYYLSRERSMIVEFNGRDRVRLKYNSSTGRASLEYSENGESFQFIDQEYLNKEDIDIIISKYIQGDESNKKRSTV